MKKNQSTTASLTQAEKKLLDNCIQMHEWHFEKLFIGSCSEISYNIIGWEKEYPYSKYEEAVTVCIYGLNAINSVTKEPTIANFFIRSGRRVYQEWRIDKAIKIQELITKEFLIKQKNTEVAKRNKERKAIAIKKVA